MTEREKEALQRIWQACSILPSEKMEFLIGYAEGVIASAQAMPQQCSQEPAKPHQ